MDVLTQTPRRLALILLLYSVVGVARYAQAHAAHPRAEHGGDKLGESLEDIVDSFDKLLGSSNVKEKLAELTKMTGSKREQIIILKKSDLADTIPEGELHNTSSIVRKIGDVTLVVNTTIDSAQDEDGVMIAFQTEVKPPPNTKVCKADKNCDKKHFCHRELFLGFDLSYCMACSKPGERCHADGHCCSKSLCRWGRCREGATSGQIGTICGKDSDCGENECCALVEGINEPICRPHATEGQHCCAKDEGKAESADQVNDNSSSISVFEKLVLQANNPRHGLPYECPCVKGLTCVNFGQTFVSVFDLPKAQYGGVCVPGWAEPDRPVAPALEEIGKLQAEKMVDALGGKKEE